MGACLRLWPHRRAQVRLSLSWKACEEKSWRLLGMGCGWGGGEEPCASSVGRKPGLCKFLERANAIGRMLHHAPPRGSMEYCREEEGSQDHLCPVSASAQS